MSRSADNTEAVRKVDRLKAWARLALESLTDVALAFRGESVRLRAMSLTYLSLFALVPALVVVFIVVQAFTGMDRISALVHEFLLENLAVGARESVAPYLDRFVKNAHATSVGLVGGGILVYSSIKLFGHIERAVNDIWKVRRRRPLRQQLFTYWAGITLGPLLLAASVTVGHGARNWLGNSGLGRMSAVSASLLLTCVFFTLIYLLVPAAKVRFLPALAGGLLAGVAWYVAKAGYTWVVGGFFRFHAIYGSVAVFPVFLTWLYLSWVLLLFGARIAYVAQHARALMAGSARPQTPLRRELLAARVMQEVALAFNGKSKPPDAEEIAYRVRALREPVDEVLALLRKGGMVVDLAGGGIAPARSLETITLADVRRIVNGPEPEGGYGSAANVAGLLAGAEELAVEALARVTYASLCEKSGSQVMPEPDLDTTRKVGVLPTA